MTEYTRPLPVPSPESRPFWEGCRRGHLLLQYCAACRTINWFPRTLCYTCGAREFDWQPAQGTGTLETYSIIHRAMNEAWKSQVPYTLAWVLLTEGVRMVTRLVHPGDREPEIGAPLRVYWEVLNDEFTLPYFEMIEADPPA